MDVGGLFTLILHHLHVEHARLLDGPAWADLYGTSCFDVCGMALTLVLGVDSDSEHNSFDA